MASDPRASFFLFLLLCPLIAWGAPDKIIYHLNSSRQDVQWKTISNLENLYLGTGDNQLEVIMLLQGEGIQLLNQANRNRDLGVRLDELRQLGMQIEVGERNYRQNAGDLAQDDPPEIVQNIFERIVDLQHRGFMYLAP